MHLGLHISSAASFGSVIVRFRSGLRWLAPTVGCVVGCVHTAMVQVYYCCDLMITVQCDETTKNSSQKRAPPLTGARRSTM